MKKLLIIGALAFIGCEQTDETSVAEVECAGSGDEAWCDRGIWFPAYDRAEDSIDCPGDGGPIVYLTQKGAFYNKTCEYVCLDVCGMPPIGWTTDTPKKEPVNGDDDNGDNGPTTTDTEPVRPDGN